MGHYLELVNFRQRSNKIKELFSSGNLYIVFLYVLLTNVIQNFSFDDTMRTSRANQLRCRCSVPCSEPCSLSEWSPWSSCQADSCYTDLSTPVKGINLLLQCDIRTL